MNIYTRKAVLQGIPIVPMLDILTILLIFFITDDDNFPNAGKLRKKFQRRFIQQYLANPAFKQSLHYKMTDEGIEVSQNGETQSQKWEDMYKAVSTSQSLIVYTSRVNASIFPKKDLGEKTSAVIQMISTYMPPKKVKIRS